MANKQAKMLRNAKVVLIEQSEVQKYPQPAKRRPINKQKRAETLKEYLLSYQKRKNSKTR